MFNFACDIDVYNWWASIVSGNETKRDYSLKYHCAFVGRKHGRSYKYSMTNCMKNGKTDCTQSPDDPIEYLVMDIGVIWLDLKQKIRQ